MDTAALVYYREAFLAGQWWLPFTAQVAHFNAPHALANLAAALLLFFLFRPFLRWQQQALALSGGIWGVALIVVLDVHCRYYAGASGALYGWAAGGALALLLLRETRTKRQATVLAMLLLLGVASKGLSVVISPTAATAWGFPIYVPAHWAGCIAGAAAAFLGHWLTTRVAPKCCNGQKG